MKNWKTLAVAGAMTLTALAGCSSGSEGGAADSGDSGKKGSVYYLNFKPEQNDAWQELAKKYTEETGVEVTVVTAASGDYENTLMSEMGKSSAPTLFQVNGPVGLKNWAEYAYDLKGTPVYDELTSDAYTLKDPEDPEKVDAIAYVIESYGIIVNEKLLKEAGYTTDDIKSFEDLKKVADDIQSRKDDLGFAAFTSAGMDGSRPTWPTCRFTSSIRTRTKPTQMPLKAHIWTTTVKSSTCTSRIPPWTARILLRRQVMTP